MKISFSNKDALINLKILSTVLHSIEDLNIEQSVVFSHFGNMLRV